MVVAALTLFACSGSHTYPSPPDWGDEPTDTFPQFYGRVPKNLLMISMDTFRKDHLDRYGDTHAAPFLSTIADHGVVMDDHLQCSNWTFASTSCTLAGRHNEEAGMIPKLSDTLATPWPQGTPFLASYLHDAGFYSILASTNGWLAPEWNNTDGYDMAYLPGTGLAWPLWESARTRLTDAIADGRASDRWLLHLHFVEPHAAYDPPEEYLEGLEDLPPVPWDLSNRDVHYEEAKNDWTTLSPDMQELLSEHLHVRYAGDISHMDDEFQMIFADMQARGLLDDTLIVFWTDHGEQFWEHGNQTHAYSLFREETEGMLWFWSPNIVPASWDGPTSSIDLVPTILKLYGLPIDERVTGIPIGESPEDRPRFMNTIARLGPASGVVQGHHKLTFSWFGTVRLFDLDADPAETNDLYDPLHPSPEAQALWSELQPMVQLGQPLALENPVNWPDELMNP